MVFQTVPSKVTPSARRLTKAGIRLLAQRREL
jgi:hypothetical protein